ncbi:MAG: hypothetical protein M3441_05025 [Chloroflexota bacterium]|nr:hypothetical protein [Chloroflexota bacterium]
MHPSRCHYSTLIAALSMLALVGCTLPFSGRSGPATPEQAVLEFYQRVKSSPPIQSYTILGSRVSGNRAIVFVLVTRGGQGKTTPTQHFVDHHVGKGSRGWETESFSSDERISVPGGSLVCGTITMGNDGVGSFTVVTGQVRQPDVAGLEVDLSSGETITDTTTDGMFAAIVPRSDPPLELRLLDDQGQVIHTVVPPLMQAQPPPPTPVVSTQPGGIIVQGTMGQTDSAYIECSP